MPGRVGTWGSSDHEKRKAKVGDRHPPSSSPVMKVAALATLAGLVAAASAQYFSEGWVPGQQVTTTADVVQPTPAAQAEGDAPPAPQAASQAGFMDTLAQGPVGSLLAKAGINLTAGMAAAKLAEENMWDRRIPLIHDDNYDELIVQEPLTAEEEAERLWFLIM